MATDNIYLTGNLESGIRDIVRASEILHDLIYNDVADVEHVRYMADRVRDEARCLSAEFDDALEAKQKSFATA